MEPLPLAQIAGLTPSDIEVAFYDDRMEPIPFDDPTDLVALSVETYTARRAYQIASEYRRRGVPVVMGGFHATLASEEVLDYADTIVVGEAEGCWPGLLDDFRSGRMKPLYRSEKRPDISKAMPDRSIFKDRDYLPVGLVEASRGCTYRCDFCSISSFFNGSQNWRDTETIVEDIKRVHKARKAVFFVDDNIISHSGRTKELCKALIPLNIKWICQADITATHDEEMLALMHRSGCQGLLVGFESLNAKNLVAMNKKHNMAYGGVTEAIRKFHKHNIRLYATFVFGGDYDTIGSFRETIDFCIQHGIFMVAFNNLTPFPGTPLYRRLEAEEKLLFESWWMDDLFRYGYVPFQSALPPGLIRDECLKARKAFYSARSILKRMRNPANRSNLFVLANYLFINQLCRREAAERENYPLGDLAVTDEILTVSEKALEETGSNTEEKGLRVERAELGRMT
jgi:radical SAM superfamily enzyme YgiQ (UPF0313 family)